MAGRSGFQAELAACPTMVGLVCSGPHSSQPSLGHRSRLPCQGGSASSLGGFEDAKRAQREPGCLFSATPQTCTCSWPNLRLSWPPLPLPPSQDSTHTNTLACMPHACSPMFTYIHRCGAHLPGHLKLTSSLSLPQSSPVVLQRPGEARPLTDPTPLPERGEQGGGEGVP